MYYIAGEGTNAAIFSGLGCTEASLQLLNGAGALDITLDN
jgi:hypothetical protein